MSRWRRREQASRCFPGGPAAAAVLAPAAASAREQRRARKTNLSTATLGSGVVFFMRGEGLVSHSRVEKEHKLFQYLILPFPALNGSCT